MYFYKNIRHVSLENQINFTYIFPIQIKHEMKIWFMREAGNELPNYISPVSTLKPEPSSSLTHHPNIIWDFHVHQNIDFFKKTKYIP